MGKGKRKSRSSEFKTPAPDCCVCFLKYAIKKEDKTRKHFKNIFEKYVFRAFCLLSTSLGAKTMTVNRTGRVPALVKLKLKSSKPGTERQIPHDLSYLWNLKKLNS